MDSFCDIEHLAKLLNPPRDNSDSEDDLRDTEYCQRNNETEQEGGKGKLDDKNYKKSPYEKLPQSNSKEEYKDFDDYEEKLFKDTAPDWKKTPKWNITYKQKVTASDVFLQLGLKSPATASCEDMLITIELPGEKMQNIDAKVLKESLEIISPSFYLKIPLPHPVDPQQGTANWDKAKEALIITLRMDREFDFINF